MISVKQLALIFSKHGGVMTTAQLHDAKLYYADIQTLMQNETIEKIKRGYYRLVDETDYSEANMIHQLFPEAILCMDTALFYHKYSDRTPAAWHIAVDKNNRKTRYKLDYPAIKPYYWEEKLLHIGQSIIVIDDCEMTIYSKERTICDCLKYRNKMDREIFNKAIQGFIFDAGKDIPTLMKYAKILRVEKQAKELLGIWL